VSKFKGLLDAARDREPEPLSDRIPEVLNTQKGESLGSQGAENLNGQKKPGRPPGKRSDPDFEQYSVHLRKATHRTVKKALLDEEDPDFSNLVERLLTDWLRARG
jgi:hypothetical protein